MSYLLRSMLFVPAFNTKFIDKAIESDADAIILDLEDSVPAIKRKEARQIMQEYFSQNAFEGKQVFVRVNELGTQDLADDMETIQGTQITGIVAPKIKNIADVEAFTGLLENCEQRDGIPQESLKLLPLIETAEAVMNVQSIAGSSKRIIALLFGGEDFLDSIWGVHEEPPRAFDVPRAMIAMAARMHNILPIDTPYLDLKNETGFREEEKGVYAMGFAGALLVNPRQIAWANECFMPSAEEIEYANRIYNAVEGAKAEGTSIATIDGKMIGPPMVKRAVKVLEMDKLVKEKEIKCR